MKQNIRRIIVLLFAVFISLVAGCVTHSTVVKVENSLPQDRVNRFNDSFDEKIRWNMWEKAGLLFSESQVENFKGADMRIEGAELFIQTKTGCFSKGGLASTFGLQGDFDIQIDCRIKFLKSPQRFDQVVLFGVYEKNVPQHDMHAVQTGLTQRNVWLDSYAVSNYIKKGKKSGTRGDRIGDFNGTFRLVRKASQVTAMYRRQNKSKWTILARWPFTKQEAFLGFKVQNFLISTEQIHAEHPVTAFFDNFQINGAQGVVESEI